MYDNVMRFGNDLREKVYQMFVLSPSGDALDADKNLIKALEKGLGGVIFFTKSIQSIEQTQKLTTDIKNTAKIPPFIGIDEEGGRVERTENIFGGKKFLSAKYQAQKGLKYVKEETQKIAELIKSLGFNMNFAPVLDVNTNPKSPIIAERAYSNTPEGVIKFGVCAMKTYLENGIIPVGKHFPGHGDVNADSHLTLPIFEKGIEELENVHIKPFKNAILAGIPAIMAAHIYCACFDKELIPASLSPNAIGYLRKNLKFNGLVVSDDMEMGGVKIFEPIDAVCRGINAGVNLFLFRDCSDKTIEIIENIIEFAQKDEILRKKIDESFEIISRTKSKFMQP